MAHVRHLRRIAQRLSATKSAAEGRNQSIDAGAGRCRDRDRVDRIEWFEWQRRRQIDLVPGHDPGPGGGDPEQLAVVARERSRSIQQHNRQISDIHCGLRARDAFLLHDIRGGANTSRIDQR